MSSAASEKETIDRIDEVAPPTSEDVAKPEAKEELKDKVIFLSEEEASTPSKVKNLIDVEVACEKT